MKVNVLIVDDEDGNRLSLSFVLSAMGHRVAEAINGLQALEYLASNPDFIDFIITDNVMPIMGGIEFIEKLHLSSFQGEIMAISANLKPSEADKLRALGVRFIVEKPFGLDTIRSSVAECLQLQRLKLASPAAL